MSEWTGLTAGDLWWQVTEPRRTWTSRGRSRTSRCSSTLRLVRKRSPAQGHPISTGTLTLERIFQPFALFRPAYTGLDHTLLVACGIIQIPEEGSGFRGGGQLVSLIMIHGIGVMPHATTHAWSRPVEAGRNVVHVSKIRSKVSKFTFNFDSWSHEQYISYTALVLIVLHYLIHCALIMYVECFSQNLEFMWNNNYCYT